MKKRLFGPLLLIVLIVGSIVGSAVIELTKGDNTEPTPNPTITPPPEDRKEIAFSAQNVDANLTELTEVHPIYGFTDETNLVEVVQAIQSLESVSRLRETKFHQPQKDKERFMPFSAEVIPVMDSNISTVKKQIREKNILTELKVFRKGVIKIPVHLKLHSIQRDLNIVRDHNFEEPFASCVVSSEAKTGDHLKVRLYLKMVGKEVIRESMQAEVMENLSSKPVLHKAMVDANISSMGKTLQFKEKVLRSELEEKAIEKDLNEIGGVESAEVNFSDLENAFSIELSPEQITDLNSLKVDLNKHFSKLEGVKRVFFYEDSNGFEARVSFDLTKDYASLRPQALEVSETVLGDYNYEFVDPMVTVSGVIEFSEVNTAKIVEGVKERLSFYGIEPDLKQQAFFKATNLKDQETGEEFPLPQEKQRMQIGVSPSLKPKDQISVQVSFYTVRGEVMIVQPTKLLKE